MNCGENFVKYALFIGNFLVAIIGLLIVWSAWGDKVAILKLFIPDSFFSDHSFWFLLCFGSSIFLVAFFGCYGALTESKCHLTLYSGVFLTVIIVEVVYGIIIWTKYPSGGFGPEWKNQTIPKIREKEGAVYEILKYLQPSFECCGIDGYQDYNPENKDINYPWSCCKDGNKDTTCHWKDKSLFKEGCFEKVKGKLFDWKMISVLVLTFLIEVACVIMPLMLINGINRGTRY